MGRGVLRIEVTRVGHGGVEGAAEVAVLYNKRFLSQPALPVLRPA